jgi:hypothetical protein
MMMGRHEQTLASLRISDIHRSSASWGWPTIVAASYAAKCPPDLAGQERGGKLSAGSVEQGLESLIVQ